MGIKEDYSARAFLDLLFNCLLGFVFLFVISFMMVEIEKQDANIKTKAEYVVTVTWEIDNPDDVDSWMRDPAGNLLWFREKEKGLMHLDRDDLGYANDTFIMPDGTTIKYPYNQEITTIRGIIPGEWVFNIHFYNDKGDLGPCHVTVKIEKLNPSVKTILLKNYTLMGKGDEITVIRFEMDAPGDIVWMDDAYVPLFSQKLIDTTPVPGNTPHGR